MNAKCRIVPIACAILALQSLIVFSTVANADDLRPRPPRPPRPISDRPGDVGPIPPRPIIDRPGDVGPRPPRPEVINIDGGEVSGADYPTEFFGSAGIGGDGGTNGRNGSQVEDRWIVADGRQYLLNLSATAGQDATAGEHAAAARNCAQPTPYANLVGASGAHGGNGGRGGHGGNGGNTTIQYTNIENLKNIQIVAAGASGGMGASGGEGAPGCRCEYSSWTLPQTRTEVSGHTTRIITERVRFECRDGVDGQNGSNGNHGTMGKPGRITLIPQLNPIGDERKIFKGTIGSLNEKMIDFWWHTWSTHSGANALLAAGSYVDDQYVRYEGKTSRQVILHWNSPQSIERFQDIGVTIDLSSPNDPKIKFDNEMTPGTWQKIGDQWHHTIDLLPSSADADWVFVEQARGYGSNMQLVLKDKKGLNQYFDTDIMLTFKRKGGAMLGFRGTVPKSAIRIEGDRIIVNLSALGMSRFYTEKNRTYVSSITVVRSKNGQQVTKFHLDDYTFEAQ